MFSKILFLLMLLSNLILTMPMQLYAQDDMYDFTIRLGEGGFRDSRSPVKKLGGGQMALDIKPKSMPFALSISEEGYTNSPEPTNSYEINGILAINMLYVSQLFDLKKTDYFLGGGIGWMEVPKGEAFPEKYYITNLYNLEAGVNYKYFKYVGFYAATKYLYAQKSVNSTKVVDFNEIIFLLGLTINFSPF